MRRTTCLRSDGAPKAGWEAREGAWRSIRRMEADGRALEGTLRPYECPRCRRFHIGRPHRTRVETRAANARRRSLGSWS